MPKPSQPKKKNPIKQWLPNRNLSDDDKQVLAGQSGGGWLNDRHVDAINNMVSVYIRGEDAQTSLLAQGGGGFRPSTTENMQILYDHNHWVAVAKVGEHVLVADSLGHDVSEGIAKQLKQLFPFARKEDGTLHATLVTCAQQPNASDCGVFAAAFLFEWATTSVRSDLNVKFDMVKMREHLMTCLETGDVVPFPKMRGSRAGSRFKARPQVLQYLRSTGWLWDVNDLGSFFI